MAVKLAICAFAPLNPDIEDSALFANVWIAAAPVTRIGWMPDSEVTKPEIAVGRLVNANWAICPDVAINISPCPAASNPGPAEAIPELAIAVKPVATAAKVPTKSPSFRSTNILMP